MVARQNSINLYQQGDLRGALEDALQELHKNPNSPITLNLVGAIYARSKRYKEAIKYFKLAINEFPEFYEAFKNVGDIYKKINRFDLAEESYRMSWEINTEFLDAAVRLFQLIERRNRIQCLESEIEKAKLIFKELPAELKYFEALCKYRKKLYNNAIEIINEIDESVLSFGALIPLLNLKAKAFDALQDYNAAFHTYSRMNHVLKKTQRYSQVDADRYLEGIVLNLNKLQNATWDTCIQKAFDYSDKSPVFLIGFPRSGTTLLDTILRSHSKIDIIEEKPLVSNTLKYVDALKLKLNLKIESLDSSAMYAARDFYYSQMYKYIDPISSDCQIDKLPLNISNVHFIKELFPGAKFILCVRHPLDCILSCWMQMFKLNPAMSNMQDLDRIFHLYNIIMEFFEKCETIYRLHVCVVKYENLVLDMKKESSKVLEFLELEWDEAMVSYQETARRRDRINTPSYSQVIQPLYQNSIDRWKNYAPFLQDYIPIIEKWMKKYGYDR